MNWQRFFYGVIYWFTGSRISFQNLGYDFGCRKMKKAAMLDRNAKKKTGNL